jgi:hypothetical protein
MDDRRFNEAEAAAIFANAAEAEHRDVPDPSSPNGLTLGELQEIGAQAGIPAESIALAARATMRGEVATDRKFLGLPLGVARTINLDRKLTDEEWERLVVDLRETFQARGSVKGFGSLRQWTNGNLAALVEPTATGQRVRLRTIKGNAVAQMVLGLAMTAFSTVGLTAAAITGALGDRGMLAALGFMGVAGFGMFALTWRGLPRWAETRRRQMEEIAERIEP